jgi:hypothetical protein
MIELFTLLALVLVVEGCLWALFPDAMRRAAARAMAMPTQTLRVGGLAFAVVGVLAVWLIRG